MIRPRLWLLFGQIEDEKELFYDYLTRAAPSVPRTNPWRFNASLFSFALCLTKASDKIHDFMRLRETSDTKDDFCLLEKYKYCYRQRQNKRFVSATVSIVVRWVKCWESLGENVTHFTRVETFMLSKYDIWNLCHLQFTENFFAKTKESRFLNALALLIVNLPKLHFSMFRYKVTDGLELKIAFNNRKGRL